MDRGRLRDHLDVAWIDRGRLRDHLDVQSLTCNVAVPRDDTASAVFFTGSVFFTRSEYFTKSSSATVDCIAATIDCVSAFSRSVESQAIRARSAANVGMAQRQRGKLVGMIDTAISGTQHDTAWWRPSRCCVMGSVFLVTQTPLSGVPHRETQTG